jgi:serine/threonine protein kinase
VKVADFGLAKLVGKNDATTGDAAEFSCAELTRLDEVVLRALEKDRQLLTGELPSGQIQPPSTKVTLDVAGKVMGTPRYMAPEQTLRPNMVDHRADIYPLGVVLRPGRLLGIHAEVSTIVTIICCLAAVSRGHAFITWSRDSSDPAGAFPPVVALVVAMGPLCSAQLGLCGRF